MPINYFLVLTSIIVHGITIPVGKGFTLVRSRTLTSRSQNGPIVSRLPAPLPFGSDALREQVERDESSNRNATIRFESPEGGKSGRKGILSNPSTPSTPDHSGASTPPPDHEPDDDRETEEMRERGEVWTEGGNIVQESEDGERVKVIPEEQYDKGNRGS